MIEEFIKNENKLRSKEFAKNLTEEDFLFKMNSELKTFEKKISNNIESKIPNIYILGLPRSGTTLIYQVIANCVDVYWPTNLMARFWEAPVTGMKLSKILNLYNKKINYKSKFGVTEGVNGPHEFGYFWMKWLCYYNVQMKRKTAEAEIDWNKLKEQLNAIGSEAQRPVVYKNMLLSCHLEHFFKIQNNSLFIYIERQLEDIAISILRARQQRYGSEEIWWSMKTENYHELMKKNFKDQIVAQVKQIDEVLKENVSFLNKNNLMQVRYSDLCVRPQDIIEEVMKKLKNLGFNLKKKNKAESFTIRNHKDHDLYDFFKKAFKA